MNRFIARSVLSLAVALPLAAQDHDLKLTSKPGASIWLVQSSTQSQEIDMGQVMESKNVMEITAHATVKELTEDGGAIVETVIARIRGSFDIPMMGEFKFDSIDNDPSKPAPEDGGSDLGGMGMPDFDAIGRAAAGFAGTKLIARLDAYGKVQSIDGIEKALETMVKRAGEAGGQMLSQSFSDKSMTNVIESAFGVRPTKPTAVGGKWSSHETSEDGPGTATKLEFTLASVNEETFEVTGAGSIEKPPVKEPAAGEEESEEAAMMREMQANMKIENGKVTGRSVVSRADGFVVEASTEMSMDLTMPGPFGDMSVKARTKIVTKRTTEEAAMKGAEKPSAPAKVGDK